ncbi:MAG: TraX family protein [Lachnospiraceae bacterium]|nr:TraX family protein [Lachnospiraceae bacterium]
MNSSIASGKQNKNSHILNTLTLKLIALFTMLIDHIGILLFDASGEQAIISESVYDILRAIGRCSFPIFCYMLVEGFHYSRNVKKYFARLVVFAIISQIPYNLCFQHTFFYLHALNIFFTLLLGLLTIYVLDNCMKAMQIKPKSRTIYFGIGCITLVVSQYLAEEFYMSYGRYGILMIVIFYLFRIPDDDFENDRVTLKYTCIQAMLIFVITYLYQPELQFYCLISFVFILMYNRKKGPGMKYLFYGFYPAHLLLLYGLYLLLY